MGAHDILGILCSNQQVNADDTPSTNTIDLAQTVPKIGVGQHSPFLCIRTAVAPTAGSGDTLAIEVQTDADDSSGAPVGSWDIPVFSPLVGASGAEIDQGDPRLATAGAWIWRAPLPMDLFQRHMRLMFRNSTTVGLFTIDAWLSDGPPSDFRGSQELFSNVGQP